MSNPDPPQIPQEHSIHEVQRIPLQTDSQKVINLELRLPGDFPPLETPYDFHIPFHFTWTSVDGDVDFDDPLFLALDALQDELIERFNALEPPLLFLPRLGRIEAKQDSFELSGSDRRKPYPYSESYEARHPKVFSLQADPELLHRRWKEADAILRSVIFERFGEKFPLPIRYYYGYPDE
ncbi:MAG: hypothetical protein Q9166_002525 [cf. Caloplaca sp. 2 TL-2023]